MPRIKSGRFFLSFALIFLLAAAGSGLAQPAPSPPPPLAAFLPKVLSAGAIALEGKIKGLESRLTDSRQELAQTEQDWQNLYVKVAASRAALAVEKPPLTRLQELLANYALLETQANARSKTLTAEADALKQQIGSDIVAENTLRLQMDALQAAGEPTVALPETRQALSSYLQAADTRDRLAAQVWNNLEKTRIILEQQRQLLSSLQPDLHILEEAWRTEILKRPSTAPSLRDQLARLGAGLAALPGHGWQWLSALAASGALGAFFWGYLFHLVGLLAFLALLGWSTRRLRRRTTQWFANWRA
ncbi:MAG TPA: hypothetical protein VIN67_03635, partial [Desulfobaccales bacterium]